MNAFQQSWHKPVKKGSLARVLFAVSYGEVFEVIQPATTAPVTTSKALVTTSVALVTT